ncbi:biogenesis of lysosome-related organelles complex 1 subunit 4-like isoform X2 [Salvelinus namaycush]|uniref:Biogenesis of lysosome-related organelles complex 1 subunit 4-like isoform X2 n=1 Tax=Salvelinus namaycush TaxID=8040 RepID=A0A8U0PCL0_SALNM|nr:biogenesis of lysosome-related organelles complex 1 subunit 4-like isoform X2 [Salvelinus namaycush]
MEPRMENRVDVLSPLEESSAEVSRDSGIVSQSVSSLSMLSEALSNGTVSQSPSFDPAVLRSPSFNSEEPDTDPDHNEEDEILRHTALSYSSYIRDTAEDEILGLEKSLEEMLTRVDEFVGMLDMVFVKMVGANVNVMEEHVTQAEKEQGTLPGAFRKIFRTISVPSFLNKPASPRRQQHQELPPVLRTDDYFTPHPGH